MAMTVSSLPDEMIFEILSCLPVKSLLRFKCVCKMWRSIIEDPKFIDRHMSRAPYSTTGVIIRENPEFDLVSFGNGLIVEKNKLTKAYRLRNLATRQLLDLPDPCEQTGTCANLCYIPATNDLKLVYMHYSEEARNRHMLVYNVLTVGSDLTWKRLDSPSLCKHRNVWPVNMVLGTVFYCIKKGLMSECTVDCLDLENDQIESMINIPHDIVSARRIVRFMPWKEKPCLARIDQDQLNAWVLENYKKHQWGDKVTIPLTFMKDYPSMSSENLSPRAVVGNQLRCYFHDRDYHAMLFFDMESKEVKFQTLSTTEIFLGPYKPNVLRVKGMRTERQLQKNLDYEHCGNAENGLIISTVQIPAA